MYTPLSLRRVAASPPRLPSRSAAARAALLWVVLLAGTAGTQAQPMMRAGAFSSGGGVGSGNHVLQSTLGQVLIGLATGPDHAVGAGFWHQVRPASVVEVDQPPSAPAITSPASGAEFVLADGSEASTLVVRWTAATDPEGAPVSYTWQLAGASDFATILLEQPAGSTTEIEAAATTLIGLLDEAGVLPGASMHLWHRATASDGRHVSAGIPAEIVLSRGTPTATDAAGVPGAFRLGQNYPNPFNPATTIAFDLPEPVHVRLVVHDVRGREVRRLVDRALPAGRHAVVLEAGEMASGIYFYRLEAGSHHAARPMLLLK